MLYGPLWGQGLKGSMALGRLPKLLLVLVTGIALAPRSSHAQNPAPSPPALPECEPALLNLVQLLEERKELAGKKRLYSGPPLGAEHSKCRVVGHWPLWPRYSVYRSNDNVNVVIEQVGRGKAPVLFGPFGTAYRSK